MRSALLLAAVLAVWTATTTAEAQGRDPALVWRTLRTEHFAVHYHEPLGAVARRIASIAERAQRRLVPIMGYEPDGRTQIVLSDDTNTANGSANALPYNVVRLFAAPPEDLDELGDYDDWPTELVTHEHLHVLHLDNISGIPALINHVFGKIYPPNSVLPRWFLEGFAVFEESELTSAGRIRSSVFDMYMRMDALEDRFLDLDQITNIADRWPHGNMWYLYGSRFVAYIDRRYGTSALRHMAADQGDEVIPFGINRMAQRATGKGFVELYDEFLDAAAERALAQREAVDARGRIEGERITFHGEEARSPRFLDEDHVVYWASDARSYGQLRSVDVESHALEEVVRVAGRGRPAPDRSGHYLYFSQADVVRDFYRFDDLFRLDRRSGEVERLTNGLRALEPDLSPDGARLAFTYQAAGTTHLAIARVEDVEGTRRVLLRSRRFEQVYAPRWSPDGRTIAASVWRGGGYRDVVLIDVASGRLTEITHDRAMDMSPTFSPDGRTLYFTSDRTGISNVYAYELESHALAQVTNVVAGAYQPTVSPSGRRLVYLGYTSYGWDLFAMPIDRARFLDAPPFVDRRPESSELTGTARIASDAYEPFSTFWPRSYQLSLTQDSFGSALGITTVGSDVVGFHSFAATAILGFEEGTINADLSYSFQHIPVPLRVRLFRAVGRGGGLLVGGARRDWIQESYGGELRAGYDFATRFGGESVSMTYTLQYIDKSEPFGGQLDPNDPPPTLPQLGFSGNLRASWFHSDIVQNGYDISPSSGRSLSFDISLSDPLLGSRLRNVGVSWSLTQYFTNPWVPLHVLAIRYAGGVSAGDQSERGVFTVGGFSSQNPIDALLNDGLLGGIALRGYAPFDRTGSQFHLIQTEYRFPLYRFNRGISTVPVYFNRVTAVAFFDVGDAFFGPFDLSTFRTGIGAQLLFDFTLGYALPYTFRIGIARGLSEGGKTQIYGHFGVPF